MNLRRSGNGSGIAIAAVPQAQRSVLKEEAFQRVIALERMRTQRSGNSILLMLLQVGNHPMEKDAKMLRKILAALASSTRETDATGWYQANAIVGVLFTDIDREDRNLLLKTMLARVSAILRNYLSSQQFNQITTSFQFFPEDSEQGISVRPHTPVSIPAPSLVPTPAVESPA